MWKSNVKILPPGCSDCPEEEKKSNYVGETVVKAKKVLSRLFWNFFCNLFINLPVFLRISGKIANKLLKFAVLLLMSMKQVMEKEVFKDALKRFRVQR